MKLICHSGTHKTASTQFQFLCRENRELLLGNNLCYPILDNMPNHCHLAFYLQYNDQKTLTELLECAYSKASSSNSKFVLISGEDFENILVNPLIANRFTQISRTVGFTSVEWIFVQRDSFDYVNSLYSELSMSKGVHNYKDLCECIIRTGYYTTSSQNYNFNFVFDMNFFTKQFKNISSDHLTVIPFHSFLDGFPGKSLLSSFIKLETLSKIQEIWDSNSNKFSNQSLSKKLVEFNYICKFLNQQPTKTFYTSNKVIIDSLIKIRLLHLEKMQYTYKKMFYKRFNLNNPYKVKINCDWGRFDDYWESRSQHDFFSKAK